MDRATQRWWVVGGVALLGSAWAGGVGGAALLGWAIRASLVIAPPQPVPPRTPPPPLPWTVTAAFDAGAATALVGVALGVLACPFYGGLAAGRHRLWAVGLLVALGGPPVVLAAVPTLAVAVGW